MAGLVLVQDGLLFADDFNRADGSLGPGWVSHTGALAIAGGEARVRTASGTGNTDHRAMPAALEAAPLAGGTLRVQGAVARTGANFNNEGNTHLTVRPAGNGAGGYAVMWNTFRLCNLLRINGDNSVTTIASNPQFGILRDSLRRFALTVEPGRQRVQSLTTWGADTARTLFDTADTTWGAGTAYSAQLRAAHQVNPGTHHWDELYVQRGPTIRVTGLPDGYQIRVGGLISAGAAGGAAVLDVDSLIAPLALLEVLSGAQVLASYSTPYHHGSTFAYEGPVDERPSPPMLSHSAVATTSAQIHRTPGVDPEGDPITQTALKIGTGYDAGTNTVTGLLPGYSGTPRAPYADLAVSSLAPTTRYYYQGADGDAGGLGAWSMAQWFDTPDPSALLATITAPADGATVPFGPEIMFTGSATDADGAPVPAAALAWSSDRDGALGSGASLTRGWLSPGAHTITLTATEGERTGSAQITLTVEGGADDPAGYATRFCDLAAGAALRPPEWVEWARYGAESAWVGALRAAERVLRRQVTAGSATAVDPLSRAALGVTAQRQAAHVVGYVGSTAGQTLGVALCGQDVQDLGNRASGYATYTAMLEGGTTLALRHRTDANHAGEVLASAPFAHAAGERLHVLGAYDPDTQEIRAKAWREGEPEPAEWMVSKADARLTYGAPAFLAYGTAAVDVAAFRAAVGGAALPPLPCCDAGLTLRLTQGSDGVTAVLTAPSYYGASPTYMIESAPGPDGPWAMQVSGSVLEYALGALPVGTYVRARALHAGGCLSTSAVVQLVPGGEGVQPPPGAQPSLVIPHAQWEITDPAEWRAIRIPWP
jgi:hypothetical protein